MPKPPRPPPGWLRSAAAAEILHVCLSTLHRRRQDGDLEAQLSHAGGGGWWISEASVRVLAEERGRWVSYVAAAERFGVAPSLLAAAVRRGELHQRQVSHSLPSLEAEEVETWVDARRVAKAQRDEQRRRRRDEWLRPPDDRVWLSAETVAIMLNRTPAWVRRLAQDDRLPHTRRGRRVWFLREHIEMVSAARTRQTIDGPRA